MAFSEEEIGALRQAMAPPGGRAFREWMRAAHFRSASGVPHDSARLALDMGWATAGRGSPRPRLTPRGQYISDAAREFCNWIDDGMGLPAGITANEVRGRRLLDVGCGWGRFVLALAAAGAEARGVEPNEHYVQLAPVFAEAAGRAAGEITAGAAEDLPFDDESFDLVLCIRALEYTDLRPALREMARVARQDGRVIIVTGTQADVWRRVKRGLLDGLLNGRFTRVVAKGAVDGVNGWTYPLLGRRLFGAPGVGTTTRPVHLREAALIRMFESSGLRLLRRDRETARFELGKE